MSSNLQHTTPETAIILAAGRGKRLRPYTDTVPKPLLTINNRPVLETVLDAVAEAGIKKVCLVVNHLASKIKSYAGGGSRWSLSISYSRQKQPLGTADALKAAAGEITGPVFILAADYALPPKFLVDLKKAYLQDSSPLFISLKRLTPAEITRKSVVNFDENGRILEIVEKPRFDKVNSLIGAALFLIAPPEIVNYLANMSLSSRGEYELTDVLNRMIQDGFSMNGLLQPQPPELSLTELTNPNMS